MQRHVLGLSVALLAALALVSADSRHAGATPPAGQCAGKPGALGVSRVVEVDATDGPQFGSQQYKLNDFLEPGEVVLTFDDGPLRAYTTPILAALDAHCTKATFFSVGKMAVADPEMVREIERRGHTVGSHTWSHRNLRSMAPALAKGELELGHSAVAAALGHPIAPFFRFPYLSNSRAMVAHAKSRNLAMWSIDVDAVDYRTRDPGTVHRRVMAGLKSHGKGIILFHDIQPSTAGALKGLLDELKAKGYKVVHLVPKVKAKTLPEYDAIAARELASRGAVAASKPLAPRAFTWPASTPPSLKPPTTGSIATPPPATPRPPASAATDPTQPSAAPRHPRALGRAEETEPWQLRIFRN